MKFTEHSANTNWYPGTTKEAVDQGYEVIPSEGVKAPYKPQVADVRVGVIDPWEISYGMDE